MKINKYVFFLNFVIGLFFIGFVIGYKNLLPTETDWIFTNGDLISYYLPLYFYNTGEWSSNIFQNPNYGLEISSSMFLYDTIQIINPILKIFSKIFKVNLQYISLWMVLCVSLQCFFSFKIIFYKTKDLNYSILGSFFFLLLPFFLDRLFIHTFVGSHWIILCSIYLIIKYDINNSIIKWSLLIFSSVFINTYLAIMIILYLFINLTFLFFFKKIKFKKILLLYLYFFFIFILFLALAGFFSIKITNLPEYGFGHYKANLLGFFDSNGGIHNLNWSTLLPDIKTFRGEEEGFSYLGISFYFIFAYYLCKINYKFSINKQQIVYLSIAVFFFLLSITNKISFGQYELVQINLNKYLFGLMSFVRASGRFIWVTAYLIVIFLIIKIYNNTKKKENLFYMLVFLIIVQIFDQSAAVIQLKKNFLVTKEFNSNDKFFWQEISKNYPNFRTSFVLANSKGATVNGKIIENYKFKATNIVYLARSDRKKLAKARYETFNDIYQKTLASDSVYWIHPDHINDFKYLYNNDANFSIFEFQNENYIVNDKKHINFSQYKKLTNNKINLPEIKSHLKLNPHEYKSLFGFGWSTDGKFWSDGPISSILFNKTSNIKEFVLEVEIFNPNKNTLGNYEFYFNNRIIKNSSIEKINNNYKIKLPIENIRQQKINNIIVKNKNKLTRADISIYPDARLLGFNIKNFYIN